MADTRETWPCPDCGHKHYSSQECPDHQWTDFCPYEGLNCPTTEVRAAKLAEQQKSWQGKTLAELMPPIEDEEVEGRG